MVFRSSAQRRAVMARLHGGERRGRLYGPVQRPRDVSRIHEQMRRVATVLDSESELRRLYKQSAYLVTLSNTREWRENLGPQGHRRAQREHEATARAINRRLAELGSELRLDEKWGPGRVVAELGHGAVELGQFGVAAGRTGVRFTRDIVEKRAGMREEAEAARAAEAVEATRQREIQEAVARAGARIEAERVARRS